MKLLLPLFPVALLAPLALAGCAASSDFPSLAMRPAERELSTEEPVRTPVMVASDPALLTRLAELRRLAAEGQSDFAAALEPARRAAAAAGGARSESWIIAQQALSRLEESRGPTSRALAELDRLRLQRAALPTAQGDFDEVEAAFAEVARLAEAQQRDLAALRAQLEG